MDWEETQEPARVVGMPRWNMASLHRNSRMLERWCTLRPSACLRSSTEVTAGHQQHMGAAAGQRDRRKAVYRLLKPAQGQLWRHHGASLF